MMRHHFSLMKLISTELLNKCDNIETKIQIYKQYIDRNDYTNIIQMEMNEFKIITKIIEKYDINENTTVEFTKTIHILQHIITNDETDEMISKLEHMLSLSLCNKYLNNIFILHLAVYYEKFKFVKILIDNECRVNDYYINIAMCRTLKYKYNISDDYTDIVTYYFIHTFNTNETYCNKNIISSYDSRCKFLLYLIDEYT